MRMHSLDTRHTHTRPAREHLEHIDLTLFGHVVFEMCCGYELTELVPGEQHYADIMKEQKLQQILHFIFQRNQDGTFAHTIKNVSSVPATMLLLL